MATWIDWPATNATHVRAVHLNELRKTVDHDRISAGLGTYGWSDGPAPSAAVHFRAVQFTELRTAILPYMSLPNWTVGSAPSRSRQVSARDINDLRSWVNTVDPPLNIWTGFHWCSPVDNSTPIPPTNQTPNQIAQGLLQSSTRWGAVTVIILGASPGGAPTLPSWMPAT